ncbi:50S ribosomal protein HLL [Raphanus sativus]|uniref:50S ribosomal protein HLL, mitochondrial isoform X2 n=1 Tax=Raphanus sativus TaxID=3726 RepID=A0A6J0N758_RAPSA|nr:50S ribosomal protein HLL, mitochondrial isoform X2 [Raphanus sativus]KAJ4903036.1 50S ribosomal protein HLL [Raphanus sativus]
MAAALASRLTKGRSLLGGLTNAFSGLVSSSSGSILSQQQQRTFIQMGTRLKVVDNSGAKEVMCIQSLRGKKGARLGDIVICSVKESATKVDVKKGKDAIQKGKVKKGSVVYGVVVRAAMQKGRVDGSQVRFDDNAVVILGIKEKKTDEKGKEKKQNYKGGFNQPLGTRVFGPVPHEMRLKKQLKILSLAQHLV